MMTPLQALSRGYYWAVVDGEANVQRYTKSKSAAARWSRGSDLELFPTADLCQPFGELWDEYTINESRGAFFGRGGR